MRSYLKYNRLRSIKNLHNNILVLRGENGTNQYLKDYGISTFKVNSEKFKNKLEKTKCKWIRVEITPNLTLL